MKMKRNGMPALLLAALMAVCLLTACDNGNSDDDDDTPATGTPTSAITTLNGRTFVCESFTYTTTYSSPQTASGINNDQPFTKKVQTFTNPYYITGTSDSDLKYYAMGTTGSYGCFDGTYTISGSTLSITVGSTLIATIDSATRFSVKGTSQSDTSTSGFTTTYTNGDQVFTEGSAPSTWTSSLSYANE